MRKKHGLFWIVLATLLATTPASAIGKLTDVRLLMSSPPCVEQRLGQVAVSIGSKEPNPRTGMAPSGVSYKKAFDKLARAAAEKGGNAVVLRDHQADYFTKGARRAQRPTYVLLQGAVVVVWTHKDQCPMTIIDPSEFERDATTRPRSDSQKDAGVSF
jgi:hypothetical protein